MAPRPRGGWQVGGRRGDERRIGPYGPDNPDPAPDCYAVQRSATGRTFVLTHYRHIDADKPCCVHIVNAMDLESDDEALARADRELLALPCHRRYRDAG
jgi:hypothetical protein